MNPQWIDDEFLQGHKIELPGGRAVAILRDSEASFVISFYRPETQGPTTEVRHGNGSTVTTLLLSKETLTALTRLGTLYTQSGQERSYGRH